MLEFHSHDLAISLPAETRSTSKLTVLLQIAQEPSPAIASKLRQWEFDLQCISWQQLSGQRT